MAFADDVTIDLQNQWIDWSATAAGTFYTSRTAYSYFQDAFDELGATALPGAMAYPTPMSAQTPTDFTLKDQWYITQDSYKRTNGGSIQTADFDTNIYLLTLQSSGYTSAVSGDIFRTVTGGTSGATGVLLDYDNTTRKWWVRLSSGTFQNNEALTIGGGTGAGSTDSSGGVATGEEGYANFFILGTVAHYEGTYWEQSNSTIDPVTAGYYAAAPSAALDLLIKVSEVGSLIDSGIVVFYNRVNRDLANSIDSSTNGDTFDWFEVNGSNFGRNPVVLNTRADLSDTLTNAQAEDYTDATLASIAFNLAGPYTADINQDNSSETYEGQVNQDSQSNEILWSVIKWFFRKGATTLIDGVEAQQFRYLDPAYAVTKDSPIGTIAGGTIFYARGWYPANVAAADASSYEVIDNGGTLVQPPVFYLREITNIPTGAKVFLARRSAANVALTAEFTLAAGNNSGNGTLVIAEAIPADKPASGFIRVFDNSGNEDRLAYSSWAGSTFTLSGTLAKTYATSNNAYVPYIDTTAATSTVNDSLQYVSDRQVVLNVRLGSGASKIEPFVSNFTITNADSSVPATAIADAINQN